jgi:ribosomal protein S12 methylthiotransferase
MQKKVHFVSLGCPKNLVDTEIMVGAMTQDNYLISPDAEGADTVVINTCGFIEDSKRESIDTILEMAQLKAEGLVKKIVVAGCLAQRYKEELVGELPEADVFVGTGQFHQIAEIIKSSDANPEQKTFFHLPTFLQKPETIRINTQPSHRAYLKISEGCLKRCAFCAIPKIRGNLQSRKQEHILSEAKLLVAGGVKELIVISHDFTDFGWDLRKKDESRTDSPYSLLKLLSEESGAQWIRLLYLYPDGVTDETLDLIKNNKNLVKYFDMPLQHISNNVLKEMNRKMTKEEIVEVLNKIRTNIPEAVIRTQFIVGFPGETEEDFEELLDFVEEQEFDRVGCFMYSPEDNTPAGRRTDQIDEETKQRRHDTLMALQQKISHQKHRNLIGTIQEVVVEGFSEETDLLLQGRTTQQAPEIDGVVYINDGQADVGDIVKVEITDAMEYDLIGRIVIPQ